MITAHIKVEGIPTLLWGRDSEQLLIAVHGAMSRKDDESITVLAEEAIARGYQVLSFDLPEHGDRAGDGSSFDPTTCVGDLLRLAAFAERRARDISLFACSMGAYFSLRAGSNLSLQKALFLSPVVDMKVIMDAMLSAAGVDEARLAAEKHITTARGPALDWDFYNDVKSHPIETWPVPTSILYGDKDQLVSLETVSSFAARFGCDLCVIAEAEHYFHTAEQIAAYRQWLRNVL